MFFNSVSQLKERGFSVGRDNRAITTKFCGESPGLKYFPMHAVWKPQKGNGSRARALDFDTVETLQID